MKVAELIERLKETPQDYDVFLFDTESGFDPFKMKAHDIETVDSTSEVYILS